MTSRPAGGAKPGPHVLCEQCQQPVPLALAARRPEGVTVGCETCGARTALTPERGDEALEQA